MKEEIKNCPFCGHKATWRRTKVQHCQLHGEPYQDYILGCFSSSCKIKPSVTSNSERWCINHWNKRV